MFYILKKKNYLLHICVYRYTHCLFLFLVKTNTLRSNRCQSDLFVIQWGFVPSSISPIFFKIKKKVPTNSKLINKIEPQFVFLKFHSKIKFITFKPYRCRLPYSQSHTDHYPFQYHFFFDNHLYYYYYYIIFPSSVPHCRKMCSQMTDIFTTNILLFVQPVIYIYV